MTTTEAFDTWWTESPENFCKAPLGSPECEMHRRTWKAAQATVQQSLIVAEALMPEPVGFRTRYRSEPEMIGHYPWTYADAQRRRRKYDRPENEYEDLYTAEQMRAMFDAATERATERTAKLCEQRADAYRSTNAPGWHGVVHECTQCAAAIRGAP